MTTLFPRVRQVQYLDDYRLKLVFSDGFTAEVDWASRIERANPDGVFAPLRDRAYFAQVRLWDEAGTICWPNGADICPDVLYEEARGRPAMEHAMELAS